MIVINRKPKGEKGIDISWPKHVYREHGKMVYTGQAAIDQLVKEKEEEENI